MCSYGMNALGRTVHERPEREALESKTAKQSQKPHRTLQRNLRSRHATGRKNWRLAGPRNDRATPSA
jgi:hypothetical protein